MSRLSAKDQILALLKLAGPRGTTTWELIASTHHSRAAGRVWDLQHEGHRIAKIEEGAGIVRWKYLGPPLPPEQLTLHVERLRD